MSYGFYSKNNNNEVIFDSDYSNYQVVGSGTVYTSNTQSNWAIPFTEIPNSAGCIILISPLNYDNYQILVNKGNQLLVYDYYGLYYVPEWRGNSSGGRLSIRDPLAVKSIAIKYILLKQIDLFGISGSGYGLECFKSNGQLAYSSNYSILNFTEKAAVFTGIYHDIFWNRDYKLYSNGFSHGITVGNRKYVQINNLGFTYSDYINGYNIAMTPSPGDWCYNIIGVTLTTNTFMIEEYSFGDGNYVTGEGWPYGNNIMTPPDFIALGELKI